MASLVEEASRGLKRGIVRLVQLGKIRKIRNAAQDLHQVDVTYRKDGGELIERQVRPYEVKAHRTNGRLMLYLTDDADGPGQIKSYAVSGLRKVERAESSYKPKWEVKF